MNSSIPPFRRCRNVSYKNRPLNLCLNVESTSAVGAAVSSFNMIPCEESHYNWCIDRVDELTEAYSKVQTDIELQNQSGKSVTDLVNMLLVHIIEIRQKVDDVEEKMVEDRKTFREEFEKSMESFRDQCREESQQYIAMLCRDGAERLTEVKLLNSILSQQLEKLKLEVELMRRQMQ